MTRFDELLAAGRAMSKDERAYALQRLTMDPMFPALVATIREQWEGFAMEASQRDVIAIKGRVEHCNGSAYGVQMVESILRKWANEDPKKVRQKSKAD